MESTLKSLNGVLDVKAELADENQGKAEIIYNPAEVSFEDIIRVIPSASGENHKFIVISATENSPEQLA